MSLRRLIIAVVFCLYGAPARAATGEELVAALLDDDVSFEVVEFSASDAGLQTLVSAGRGIFEPIAAGGTCAMLSTGDVSAMPATRDHQDPGRELGTNIAGDAAFDQVNLSFRLQVPTDADVQSVALYYQIATTEAPEFLFQEAELQIHDELSVRIAADGGPTFELIGDPTGLPLSGQNSRFVLKGEPLRGTGYELYAVPTPGSAPETPPPDPSSSFNWVSQTPPEQGADAQVDAAATALHRSTVPVEPGQWLTVTIHVSDANQPAYPFDPNHPELPFPPDNNRDSLVLLDGLAFLPEPADGPPGDVALGHLVYDLRASSMTCSDLTGGILDPGDELACHVTVDNRAPATAGAVRLELPLPDEIAELAVSSPPDGALVTTADGRLTVAGMTVPAFGQVDFDIEIRLATLLTPGALMTLDAAVAGPDADTLGAELIWQQVVDCVDCDGDGVDDEEDCQPFDATIHPGAVESCNGRDDDCDETIDEGFETVGQACDQPDDEDNCAFGTFVCSPAGDSVTCINDVVPDEICNGQDDDCDGLTDEGFAGLNEPCDGPDSDFCLHGTYRCRADHLGVECGPEQPADIEERCNGFDDDCDGAVDNRFWGIGEPCDGPDADFCAKGTLACTQDGLATVCEGDSPEPAETCDNRDQDCDGRTDEDFLQLGQPCDGPDSDACRHGRYRCRADGNDVECGPEEPSDLVELCNGSDDDCDGATDEDFDDGDGDGVNDCLDSDDDDDGLADADELLWHSDPFHADSDDDGLPDGAEVNEYQTDPTKKDTDSDQWDDPDEIECGSDPSDGQDRPADLDDDKTCDVADGCIDADEDGFGAGTLCLAADCLDTAALCTTDCADDNGNGQPDCNETCLDEDGDGFGQGSLCSGIDCDDTRLHCTTDCADTDEDGLPDCDDDCLDADADRYGSGSGCLGTDCDDTQAACSANCEDSDDDGTADCAEPRCAADEDCPPDTHCEPTKTFCVECLGDEHCAHATCDTQTNTCTPWACQRDADCIQGFCDADTHACRAWDCTADSDCTAGSCAPDSHTCIPWACTADADCTAGSCDLESHTCIPWACAADADCTAGSCEPDTHTCIPWACSDDADCSADQSCAGDTHRCVPKPECSTDEDCDSVHFCSPQLGLCQTYPCAAQRPCPQPDQRCDLAAGKSGGICIVSPSEGGIDGCASGGPGSFGPFGWGLVCIALARRRKEMAKR